MKYCTKCGAGFEEEYNQCPVCGEPCQAQANAEQPIQEDYIPMQEDFVPTPEVPQITQKPKKKLWLWITLAVLITALSAAAVWFFFLRSDDAKAATESEQEEEVFSINKAISQSIDQLKSLTANAENLHESIDAIRACLDEKQATITIAYPTQADSFDIGINARIDYIVGQRLLSGNVVLDVREGNNTAQIGIDLALSEKRLQLFAPELMDEILEFKITELDVEETEGETSSTIDKIEKIKDLLEKEAAKLLLDELIDQIQVLEETKEQIAFGEDMRECTAYTVSYDRAILMQLLNGLLPDMVQEEDLDVIEKIRILVYDRQVVGALLDIKKDDTVKVGKLLLCGAENPWSEVHVFVDEEEKASICTSTTDNGFEMVITNVKNATEAIILCDDQAQILRLQNRSTGDEIILHYQTDDGAVSLTVEGYNLENPITFGLAPLEKEPSMLSENAKDVEQMSDLEKLLLLTGILNNLKENPQTKWIFDRLNDSILDQAGTII